MEGFSKQKYWKYENILCLYFKTHNLKSIRH